MRKIFTLKSFFLFLLSFLIVTIGDAQIFSGKAANDILDGAKMIKLNEKDKTIQYVLFETPKSISEESAVEYLKKLLKMEADESFTIIKEEKDELGFHHLRIQQTKNKIPVLGGVFILHFKNDKLHSFNGVRFILPSQSSLEIKTETNCLQIALDSMGAKSYMWEYPEEELAIQEIKEDIDATWYPKGELIYVPEHLDFNNGKFYLTYKFNVHAFEPRLAENMFVDVETGRMIARENQLHTTDVNGLAYTKYSGQKAIITDSISPFNYRLRELTRGNGVYTLNMKKGTNYGAAVDFTDSNNYWNNVNVNEDEVATDCHWGAETTYDYYKLKFNRNSFNNNNARIVSYVHYSNNYDNAFWDGVRMTYGDGNTFKPLTSIDVCGHEITHAVTSNSANLIYSYESGQLNESFSDIFGNSIERYGKPNDYSWKIGEEITNDSSGLRNMLNPKLKGHPRCYKSTNWYFGTGDNGGVHLNSGVQNWWYYLITEGGSGTNDVSNVYNVDSLGMDKAEQIAYRNLTVYLTPTSQYADARFYSIRAAVDLFGECSKEVIAVTNAWYACNVGPAYDSGFVKAEFTADTIVCSGSKSVNFKNLSSNANNVKWYFGDGGSSILYNATHTYNAFGSFNIKLVANSCFKNIKDSITKVAYIKIDSTYDICNSVIMPATGIDSTNKCQSFVYDEGAEDVYRQNKTSYFRISVAGADTIQIQFKDFDYEANYDSIYLYKGIYPGSGTLIGGYTGSNLPNAGNFINVLGGVVTIKQFSDPYVVGRGFKLFYKAIRKPLNVIAFSDTSICKGSSVQLFAKGTGGYVGDYHFNWKGIAYNDSILVQPNNIQNYKVILTDVCTKQKDSAEITVSLKPPLSISGSKDTILCEGRNTQLTPIVSGGDASNYTLTWSHGLGTGASKLLQPIQTTTYSIILSDNCTPINDTMFYTVRVKDSLKIKLVANNSDICYNNMVNFTAQASGGDTMQYQYTWSEPGAMQDMLMKNFISNTWVKVKLNDFCSVNGVSDSIYINVKAPLSIQKSNDTLICYGSKTILNVIAQGGDAINYEYVWLDGFADTSRVTVSNLIDKKYYVTLRDNCSNSVNDSFFVQVMEPLNISGLRDTVICNGNSVDIAPIITGGLSNQYNFRWNFGLSNQANQTVSPTGPTQYRLIFSDACSSPTDTGFVNVIVKAPLKIDIETTDTLICYDGKVNLKSIAKGGNSDTYQYTWSNGLGNLDSASSILKQSQWIKLTLNDGCTVQEGLDSVYITVRDEMKVVLGNDTVICYGTSLHLNAIVKGGDSSAHILSWNNGLTSNSNHIVSPLTNQTYIVKLNDNCSEESIDTIVVQVLQALKISGLRDTVLCYGQSTLLKPNYTGGKILDYQIEWDNGIGFVNQTNVQPLNTTTYKVTLKDACSMPYDSTYVKVSVLDALSLNSSLDKNVICENDSVRLKLNFNGGKTNDYTWFLNGVQSFDTVQVLKPLSSQSYYIELRDNCSITEKDTLNVLVNKNPIVDFTIDDDTICAKQSIQFTNSTIGGNTYLWTFSDTSLSSDFEPSYKYDMAAYYSVKLKATSIDNCSSELFKDSVIKVVDLPISKFDYSPKSPNYIHPNVSFIQQSINYVNYEWDFGDFSKNTTDVEPNYKYADTGYYNVRLIAINELGCSDTSYQMIRVKDVYILNVPTAISVNNDNLNETLEVIGRGFVSYELQIYSRWGEQVFYGNQDTKAFDGKMSNGEQLMKGTYLLILTVRDFEGGEHYIRQMLELL